MSYRKRDEQEAMLDARKENEAFILREIYETEKLINWRLFSSGPK